MATTSTRAQALAELDHYLTRGRIISTETARLWASWWGTPDTPALVALAAGEYPQRASLLKDLDSQVDVLIEVRSAFESWLNQYDQH